MTKGMLYLCATPIGNLGDMSARAIEILRSVDVIAAEDTRNSIKLLNHFEIKTPMTSYHEFNKYDKADDLVRQMLEGKNIACITDAGTPGISDPGEVLVEKCYEAGIVVTSIPGPAACINALILSGLSTRRFRFEAFLPTDKKERNRILKEVEKETATLIFYEAPHHLVKTLEELKAHLGNRRIALCKELTKRYENIFRTTIEEALSFYEVNDPKGEFVIVMEGVSMESLQDEERMKWEEMSIKEHMNFYLEQGMEKKEAMKAVAKDRGISKRDVYQELLD